MEGKVIAITGGASGIGLASAKLLASRGADISIADVSQANLDKAVPEIKSASSSKKDILASIVDVRNIASVHDWIKQTVDKFGKLDGAANLAGVIGAHKEQRPTRDLIEDDWDFVIGVNLTGVMHSMKEELKVMTTGGSIVNASSVAGLTGLPSCAAYCASKHGVIGLTRTAAKEEGSRGIRVNAIAPGMIDTPMLQGAAKVSGEEQMSAAAARMPLGRKGEAEEVAKLIVFLLSDEASFSTGTVASIDGGWVC